jgi:anti-sigma factor RsiW
MATEEFMDRSLQHAFDAEEVMAYLDGELEPQRASMLASHLEHCAECQEVARELRTVSGRMLDFEIGPVPAGVTAAVVAELKSPRKPEPVRPLDFGQKIWARWHELPANHNLWAFAAGFAIVLMAVILARPRAMSHSKVPTHAEPILPAAPQAEAAEGYKSWLQEPPQALRSPNVVSTAATQRGAEPGPPPPPPQEEKLQDPGQVGTMIVQTASLSIVAKSYDEASEAIGKLARARGGYVEKLDAKAQTGSARELSIALRVPAKQLDGFLEDLRQLGHVEQESQSNEEVSAEYVDLQARLRSAQATERRLIELLATRTGRLEDVLDVERELARVRGEIESMQGQSNLLLHRVSYATVQVELSEIYHQRLQLGVSTGTKLRNAFVEGVHNLEDGIVGALVFVLDEGPAILFWLAVLGLPVWLIWRRWRSRAAAKA